MKERRKAKWEEMLKEEPKVKIGLWLPSFHLNSTCNWSVSQLPDTHIPTTSLFHLLNSTSDSPIYPYPTPFWPPPLFSLHHPSHNRPLFSWPIVIHLHLLPHLLQHLSFPHLLPWTNSPLCSFSISPFLSSPFILPSSASTQSALSSSQAPPLSLFPTSQEIFY